MSETYFSRREGIFGHSFRSAAQNLSIRLGRHWCFSSWNETLLTLEGTHEVIWGHIFETPPSLGPYYTIAIKLLLFSFLVLRKVAQD